LVISWMNDGSDRLPSEAEIEHLKFSESNFVCRI